MAVIPVKKPLVIYVISLVYTLLALGGLISSISKLQGQPLMPINPLTLELVVYSIAIGAGISLSKPHRYTWTLALLTLIAIFSLEAYLFLNLPLDTPINYAGEPLKIFLSSIFGFFILYFFRFPYLDRRDMWKSTAVRYEVRQPIEILDHGQHMLGSISMSGARIDLQYPIEVQREQIIHLVFPEADPDAIPSRVVDYNGEKVLRIEFRKPPAQLRAWLKKTVKQ